MIGGNRKGGPDKAVAGRLTPWNRGRLAYLFFFKRSWC